ncbi:glycosyltransferase [Gottfriedia sp. S16(2024)]|uniref:glycosyltransferase n=1 Tax=Gottfriedia sp. S16(2024) TaxID=3162883 RepID=UPI003D25E249
MIFATVGTHEQQFNRLVKQLDILKENNIIKKDEEVIIQTGYSNYTTKYCTTKKIMGYDEMIDVMKKARIIITHGGPGSIFSAIQMGKIPIVVPRNPIFDEHVDGHQVDFVKRMNDNNRVIGVFEIIDLESTIINYETLSKKLGEQKGNNKNFVTKFIKLVDEMFIN